MLYPKADQFDLCICIFDATRVSSRLEANRVTTPVLNTITRVSNCHFGGDCPKLFPVCLRVQSCLSVSGRKVCIAPNGGHSLSHYSCSSSTPPHATVFKDDSHFVKAAVSHEHFWHLAVTAATAYGGKSRRVCSLFKLMKQCST